MARLEWRAGRWL